MYTRALLPGCGRQGHEERPPHVPVVDAESVLSQQVEDEVQRGRAHHEMELQSMQPAADRRQDLSDLELRLQKSCAAGECVNRHRKDDMYALQ